MKKTILLVLCLVIAGTTKIFAQSTIDLSYIDLKGNDTTEYEQNFVAAVKWLQITAFGKEQKQRDLAKAFIIAWITNSPTVSFVAGEKMLDMVKNNPELMVIYMGSFSRSMIEAKHDNANIDNAVKTALEATLIIYQKGNGMKKNKLLDKLIKNEKDKEQYLASLIEEQKPKKK